MLELIDSLKNYFFVIVDILKAHWLLLMAISIASVVLSVLFCTLVIAYLPADYFLPHTKPFRVKHPILGILLKCLRNILALVLIVIGVAQLFLPGQGVLTMLIGIVISDIPGKRNLERRLIRLPAILAAANSIRSRFKRPPLILEEPME